MIFRKILFLFCVPFSFIYYFLVFLRNVFYGLNIFRKHKINAKVVSVGNITWGGTGKTPVAAFIADLIGKRNHRAAILIRGYGNDESELLPKLATNAHVFTGKDRVKTGREAIEHGLADTIILDDGFQYRRLKRDLDIVCVDAVNPFGNGWVIPAGSMREGKRSLKRADIFLITKSDLVSSKDKLERVEKKLKNINPEAVIAKAIHRPLYFYRLSNDVGARHAVPLQDVEKVSIDQFKSKEIALVSAIGSPECFEKTIQRLGLKINKHFIFRDHHLYTKDEMDRISVYCSKNNINTIISTEKDAVKLEKLFTPPVKLKGQEWMALKVRLEIIENEDGFSNRLFGIYNS